LAVPHANAKLKLLSCYLTPSYAFVQRKSEVVCTNNGIHMARFRADYVR